jgi:nicotinic acid mononucleotide adenylyltransferase
MRTLGYIVVGKKLTNIEGFVEQVHSIEEADSTKPILIIGWDNAKQFEGYNILDRKLSEGVFWTFSRAENRYEFEKDLKKFYNYIFDNVTKYIIYDYINIYKLKYSKLKELYRIFISKERNNIYISSNMMYAVLDDKILGVSFPMLEYCGISRDKVLKRIKENKSDGIIYDNSRDVIKLGRFLGNKKYAIPYFV